MKKSIIVLSILLLFSSLSKAQETKAITIGETKALYSEILNEERKLNIYLPPNYDKQDTVNYHIIYLLDGGLDEDFIHISGIVQFLTFSWINKIPPTIVVGIENIDRKRDFTYSTEIAELKKDFPTSGRSAKFIQFIEEELKPFIDKEYRTNAHTTLIGQSFAGLLATEILLNNPYLFDNYIIISPSMWWDDQSLLKQAIVKRNSEIGIYISVGKEGEIMEGGAKALYQKLKEQKKIYFQFFPTRDHGDVLHEAAYDALEKLFAEE